MLAEIPWNTMSSNESFIEDSEIKQRKIQYVLDRFEEMGASSEDIKTEKERLEGDESYYKNWCMDIGFWCPGYDDIHWT